MPDPAAPRPRTGRWSTVVGLHAPFLLAVTGCLFAGWFELTRARAGREVAWVYAVEWPLFAILGTYIWWRKLHESPALPTQPAVPDDPRTIDRLDPGLVAWQEYLARLHAADPPGGPPQESVNASPPQESINASPPQESVNARRQERHSRGRPPEKEG